MLGFLLIGLGKGIPALGLRVNVPVSSNEGFLFVDSNDFDDLAPLLGDIALFISLDDDGLDVVIVIATLIIGSDDLDLL